MNGQSQDPDSGLDAALRLAFGDSTRGAGAESLKSSPQSSLEASPDSPPSSAEGMHPGKRVGAFLILERIGAGAMGEVFLADDERLERRVALKVIRSSRAIPWEAKARFQREARILSQLDHPGICRIFDYVETDDVDFLVLEWIDGEPLSSRLKTRLPHGVVLDYALQISRALAVAHAKGIVHRDLKPGNLMVTRDGTIKILDFGIARARAESGLDPVEEVPPELEGAPAASLTRIGAIMGTLDYMSPEQARGESTTPATDIYSLGLLMHEMWTGEPARPRGLDPLSLLKAIERNELSSAQDTRRDISDLVSSMCSGVPTERPTAKTTNERLHRIKERPRRLGKRAIAAALILGAAAGGTKYSLDLRTAHARVLTHQERADGLIQFMHDDLWEKLSQIGQLAILEDICDRSTEYFESIPTEQLSDEQLLNRCLTLRHIGTVWRDKRGEGYAKAMRALEASWRLADDLVTRNPALLDRLFERSQCEFYLGETALNQRSLDDAQAWLERYQKSAAKLVRTDPTDEDFAMELAWSEQALGAVFLAASNPAEARRVFGESVTHWRIILADESADPTLAEELAAALAWLGEATLSSGDVGQATQRFTESTEAWDQLLTPDTERRDWLFQAALVRQQLAKSHLLQGESPEALSALEASRVILIELCEWDSKNVEWSRALALNALHAGRSLMARNRPGQNKPDLAAEKLDQATATLEDLLALEPDNRDLIYQCAAARIIRGEHRLISHMASQARRDGTYAAKLLAQLATQSADEARQGPDTTDPLLATWRARAELLLTVGASDEEVSSHINRALRYLAPHDKSCLDPRFLGPADLIHQVAGHGPMNRAAPSAETDSTARDPLLETLRRSYQDQKRNVAPSLTASD